MNISLLVQYRNRFSRTTSVLPFQSVSPPVSFSLQEGHVTSLPAHGLLNRRCDLHCYAPLVEAFTRFGFGFARAKQQQSANGRQQRHYHPEQDCNRKGVGLRDS